MSLDIQLRITETSSLIARFLRLSSRITRDLEDHHMTKPLPADLRTRLAKLQVQLENVMYRHDAVCQMDLELPIPELTELLRLKCCEVLIQLAEEVDKLFDEAEILDLHRLTFNHTGSYKLRSSRL